MEKVTKHILKYPENWEPDLILPKEYGPCRYTLGKMGTNPLVAICMNPSAAKEECSDSTINRIIKVSQKLNHDGWIVFNLYPERATDAKNLEGYNKDISEHNMEVIRSFLIGHGIKEVWGAWGNSNGIETLELAKADLLKLLRETKVRVFYFGTLTKEGNPRHPLQRNEKVYFEEKYKKYI